MRDVYLPPDCLKCGKIKLQPNPYDYIVFNLGNIYLLELKSTKQKSFQLSDKIIKKHQIHSLTKYQDTEGVVSGFVFNFALWDNQTYFLDIKDFNDFVLKAERKSIPLDYCQNYGTLIDSKIKVKNYIYDINKFTTELKERR